MASLYEPQKYFIIVLVSAVAGLVIYYIYPIQKIPTGIDIDKIIVYKSTHELFAYSNGKLIVTYKISIGTSTVGDKEIEGDMKTPEGSYLINSKNTASNFHKNLGISYPNQQDIQQAKVLGDPPGGEIKIHGLKNGQGFIGKFHRWKDWTNGCIALTDDEMDQLYMHTSIGTLIEIRK